MTITGVGQGSERMSLVVSKLIGPHWTEQHEKEFQGMMKQHADHSFVVPVIAENIFRHRKLLVGLMVTQVLMLGALVALAIHVFWR